LYPSIGSYFAKYKRLIFYSEVILKNLFDIFDIYT
jgi:hypothetical protein